MLRIWRALEAQRAILIERREGKQVSLQGSRPCSLLLMIGQLLERYFESRAQKVSRDIVKAIVTSSPFAEALKAL